ncbi:MAG: transketolase [Nitrospinota bacterium]|nr:MAG: transketolase [Nitrospinota bacterium]
MDSLIEALQNKANLLRVHSIRATTRAGSGHPTSCLSAAELVATLFFAEMRYDPHDHAHPNNDRFVLSKGHAAPLLYAAWAEAGIIPLDALLTLRKIDSDLEGHPTPRLPWIDVATGSLGQGLSVGVGMALNGKYLDRLDYRVYVLLGDGECAEGAVWEAAALAAYYKLDNLVGIIDVNGLGQSQQTMYGGDVEAYQRRFAAFGWHSLVIDGHQIPQILSALQQARSTWEKPTMIVARTEKGKGAGEVAGRDGWHGKPLPPELADRVLAQIPIKDLSYPLRIEKPRSRSLPTPPPAAPFPPPAYEPGAMVATREAYGTALVKLGEINPLVVVLDGDTKNSTFAQKFAQKYPERYFESFIAEQNMVGMAAGLAARGKIPFTSTFAAFLTRSFDQMRMAAVSGLNMKYAGSHCGVSIGEDGPSQMGLEDLAMMRALPGAVVLYPADAVSTEWLVKEMAEYQGIAYLRTSRPKTPVLYSNEETFPLGGSKVLRQSPADRVTLVGAGITVHEALKAFTLLQQEGIAVRVIDAYSVKPLDVKTLLAAASQTNHTLITIEDHYPEGGLGDAVAGALSPQGIVVHKLAVQGIPRSGKPAELLDMYGISARCIVEKVKELV